MTQVLVRYELKNPKTGTRVYREFTCEDVNHCNGQAFAWKLESYPDWELSANHTLDVEV